EPDQSFAGRARSGSARPGDRESRGRPEPRDARRSPRRSPSSEGSTALRFRADGDPITAAVPSDQTVRDADSFRAALNQAAAEADRSSVVMLAVRPTRPDTDFGYVEIRDGEVSGFVEKPDAESARAYAASGRHFWNAGIFVFRPSRLLEAAREVAGELVSS